MQHQSLWGQKITAMDSLCWTLKKNLTVKASVGYESEFNTPKVTGSGIAFEYTA